MSLPRRGTGIHRPRYLLLATTMRNCGEEERKMSCMWTWRRGRRGGGGGGGNSQDEGGTCHNGISLIKQRNQDIQ